jgi:hypothetical protein
MGVMTAVLIWLGLFPQSVLNTAAGALKALQQYTAQQGITSIQTGRTAPIAQAQGSALPWAELRKDR